MSNSWELPLLAVWIGPSIACSTGSPVHKLAAFCQIRPACWLQDWSRLGPGFPCTLEPACRGSLIGCCMQPVAQISFAVGSAGFSPCSSGLGAGFGVRCMWHVGCMQHRRQAWSACCMQCPTEPGVCAVRSMAWFRRAPELTYRDGVGATYSTCPRQIPCS